MEAKSDLCFTLSYLIDRGCAVRHLRRTTGVAAAAALTVLALLTPAGSPPPAVAAVAAVGSAPAAPAWLTLMNRYRSAYGVPAVVADPALSAADAVHVSYMRDTGTMTHSEDPKDPHYSAVGDQAARRSNLAMGWGSDDAYWIEMWMVAPFHALGILRPTLTRSGFASGGGYAALDVISGIGAMPAVRAPLTFPADQGVMPYLRYGGEWPDALAPCPARFSTGGASAPVMVSLGPGATPVTGATARLVDPSGTPLATCVLTELTYTNSNASEQSLARGILAENHSVVVFGAGAFQPGRRYTLTLTPTGRTPVTVRFTVAGSATTSPTTKPGVPAVTKVSPTVARVRGGTLVTITGRNLTSGSAVTIGGVRARVLKRVGSTRLVVRAPAHRRGTAAVTVRTAGGSSSPRRTARLLYR
jgi:hypothetical protein